MTYCCGDDCCVIKNVTVVGDQVDDLVENVRQALVELEYEVDVQASHQAEGPTLLINDVAFIKGTRFSKEDVVKLIEQLEEGEL